MTVRGTSIVFLLDHFRNLIARRGWTEFLLRHHLCIHQRKNLKNEVSPTIISALLEEKR